MRQDVEFTSGGDTVRGHLYLPDNGAAPFPVVRHGRRLVLRQRAGAARTTPRRSSTPAGRPRVRLPPLRRQLTARLASTSTRGTRSRTTRTPSATPRRVRVVDAERIAVWGISYSGGHALIVGATDPRVKCVVSTIPVVDGLLNMQKVHGARLPPPAGSRRGGSPQAVHHRRAGLHPDVEHRPRAGGRHVAVPRGDRGLQEPPGDRSARPRAPQHHRRRSSCSSTTRCSPTSSALLNTPTLMIVAEGDDITLWDGRSRPTTASRPPRSGCSSSTTPPTWCCTPTAVRLEIAADQGAQWLAEHLVTPFQSLSAPDTRPTVVDPSHPALDPTDWTRREGLSGTDVGIVPGRCVQPMPDRGRRRRRVHPR